MTADQRLLLVHAHPDDESIGQGATMARYVAEGRGVTLVTCTAGEMGEILVPELEHLAADREDGLGEHRRTEHVRGRASRGVLLRGGPAEPLRPADAEPCGPHSARQGESLT